MTEAAAAGFGVYVHWPFCARKCPYCDFNSHVRETVDQRRWRDALMTVLAAEQQRTRGRTVTSVFFGGGTPSLMPPETAKAILDAIGAGWPLAADLEVTLEANPGSVEAARFRDFRAAGINRVSIGVQSLDDEALRFLGRVHSASEARAAVETAAAVFERYSLDLIYALPGQSAADWSGALNEALRLAGDHISAYTLTIEPGTAFHTLERQGKLAVPDPDTAADLYEVTQEILASNGFEPYEVSNHAREGAACRHNLIYWRYQDYVGIGPGAHGRLSLGEQKFATVQRRLPERWLEGVAAGDAGRDAEEPLDQARRTQECAMMGLRLTEGLPTSRLLSEGGETAQTMLDSAALVDLIEGGFIEADAGRLKATAAGRLVLNAVLRHWFAGSQPAT